MQSRHSKSKTEILDIAIPLFAEAGFNGVSMRDIAGEVGIMAASLYHHFRDKHTLYMAAMSHAFARKTKILSVVLAADVSPEQRLEKFVTAFCQLVHDNPDFTRLMQREILAGDDLRLRLVEEQVAQEFFSLLLSLCRELAPDHDPHLLSISILGLVVFHYQITPLRQLLPGSRPQHNDPEVVVEHVMRLLLNSVSEPFLSTSSKCSLHCCPQP